MARLNIDFSALHSAVKQMNAEKVDFKVNLTISPVDPIDLELIDGIEISLEEVEPDTGLLAYKGRQIVLYIKDHGWNVQKALEKGEEGRRFHVADCKTLQTMRARNRYDRYHVVRNLNGEFEISGYDKETNKAISGTAHLKVCMNCLKKLNYKGYASGTSRPKQTIWKKFSIDEFFQTYSSFFKYLPNSSENEEVQYTDDWRLVAGRLKADRNFICEQCHVNLSEQKNLLHVHHVNGVKSDNRPENLKVLCIDCHRKQDSHGHMFVHHEDMQTISRLRRKQKVSESTDWANILKLADPAARDILDYCKHKHVATPEIAHNIVDNSGKVIGMLEVAWPSKKIGIAIDNNDRELAIKQGWDVWPTGRILEDMDNFITHLRQ